MSSGRELPPPRVIAVAVDDESSPPESAGQIIGFGSPTGGRRRVGPLVTLMLNPLISGLLLSGAYHPAEPNTPSR